MIGTGLGERGTSPLASPVGVSEQRKARRRSQEEMDEMENTIRFLEQELAAARSQLDKERSVKKRAKQETFLKLAVELSSPNVK